MKLASLIFVLLLAGGVSARAQELRDFGARDATGAPTGAHRLVDRGGVTQAQGSFRRGKMHGRWTFFDTRRTKIAELNFTDGTFDGPYRLFYSSVAVPSAAGRPKTVGIARAGRITGEHIVYLPGGEMVSRATFDGVGVRASVGSPRQAQLAAASDLWFVSALRGFVQRSVR